MTPRRLKSSALVAGIALSGLVLLAFTQEWFSDTVTEGPTLSVAGDVAAPALATLALSGLVLAGALAIAGPFFRVVLGVLQSLLGATILLSAVLALAAPAEASASVVTDATGVAGEEAATTLVASLTVGLWGYVGAVAGALLVVLGILIVVTSRRWPSAGRKYGATRVEATDAEGNPVDTWDALSDGHDPT